MSEEEMKALVEMNNMLKAKLEQQTKVYQQSLQEMQNEIDDLQRNCDVFNEQMNDAVARTIELKEKIYNAEKMLKRKIEKMKQDNAFNRYFYDIKDLEEVLKMLVGEE